MKKIRLLLLAILSVGLSSCAGTKAVDAFDAFLDQEMTKPLPTYNREVEA